LLLSDGSIISDHKKCVIQKEKEKIEKPKGGNTTVSRPNYQIDRVFRADWPALNWSEENVGDYGLTRDAEDKDLLRLRVNIDNANIDVERDRRRRLSQNEKTIQNVETKYVAHIAYHLFQQYDHEKEEYNQEISDEDNKPKTNGSLTEEQKQDELMRVSKTLVLSFKAMRELDDE
jgi:hypothetical protein